VNDQEQCALTIENLTVGFHTGEGVFPAVDGVSWNVMKNEIVALVGESGSGKTVSCLSMLGLIPSAKVSGSVRFLDKELVGLPQKELQAIRGRDIGFVFQEPMTSLDPVFTVGSQMDETMRAHTALGRAARRERGLKLFEMVGIPEPEKRYRCYPFELSGGMKQRVMIAMALCCDPALLIADEPTTALDVTIQAQVLSLLKGLQRQFGMSIIIISHDLGVVANFAHRVVVMYAGKIIEQGATQKVLHHPQHPYTKGLLASMPNLNTDKGSRLNVIPGSIPDLAGMPKGCRFSPRCADAIACCKTLEPPEILGEDNSMARCWQYVQKEGGSRL